MKTAREYAEALARNFRQAAEAANCDHGDFICAACCDSMLARHIERALAEAYEAGAREMRERAADVVHDDDCKFVTKNEVEFAIRALPLVDPPASAAPKGGAR